MKPDIGLYKQEYFSLNKSFDAFGFELSKQLEQIFSDNDINLGFPAQYRTKGWESIERKLQSLKVKSILDIQDLCGLRYVLLFKRDVPKVKQVISKYFNVIKEYDTQERLDSDQFGYSSLHLIIKMPDKWFEIPTLKNFNGLKAEVQIRTLAQHTWAAASHVLQYKSETTVPKSILRAVYRVSAILETVDIEFERFLTERELYIEQLNKLSVEDINQSALNVDLLEKVLDESYPSQNKTNDEEFALLLEELAFYNVKNVGDLVALIKKHYKSTIETDVESSRGKGFFFSHTGLVRVSLEKEDPKKYQILSQKWRGEVNSK